MKFVKLNPMQGGLGLLKKTLPEYVPVLLNLSVTEQCEKAQWSCPAGVGIMQIEAVNLPVLTGFRSCSIIGFVGKLTSTEGMAVSWNTLVVRPTQAPDKYKCFCPTENLTGRTRPVTQGYHAAAIKCRELVYRVRQK